VTLGAGQTICGGRYVVIGQLGQGARSRLWLAREVSSGLRVAVKEAVGPVFGPELDEATRRFAREKQVSEQLTDLGASGAVRVLRMDQEQGIPLLVLEYCPGGSLADRLKAGPLTVAQAVEAVLQVCDALLVLHRRLHYVHRDVKPGNILFDAEGHARLADLGLVQTGDSSRSGLEAEPHPGTPGYMCPEQDTTRGYLTPRCDVYALGCVLFEAVTGKRYLDQPAGTKASALHRGIPPWVDDVLAKALAPDPFARFADAGEMAAAFRRRPAPTWRWVAVAVCVALGALAVAGLLRGAPGLLSPRLAPATWTAAPTVTSGGSATATATFGVGGLAGPAQPAMTPTSTETALAAVQPSPSAAPVPPAACAEYLSREEAAGIARTVVGAGIRAAVAYRNADGRGYLAALRDIGYAQQVHLLEQWGATYKEVWASESYVCMSETLGTAAFGIQDVNGDGACEVSFAEYDSGNIAGQSALNLYASGSGELYRVDYRFTYEISGMVGSIVLSPNLEGAADPRLRDWFEERTTSLGIVPPATVTSEEDLQNATGEWYLDNPFPYTQALQLRTYPGKFDIAASIVVTARVGSTEYVSLFKGPICAYDAARDTSWIVHASSAGEYGYATALFHDGAYLWFDTHAATELYRLDPVRSTIQRYLPVDDAAASAWLNLRLRDGAVWYQLSRTGNEDWKALSEPGMWSDWRRVNERGGPVEE